MGAHRMHTRSITDMSSAWHWRRLDTRMECYHRVMMQGIPMQCNHLFMLMQCKATHTVMCICSAMMHWQELIHWYGQCIDRCSELVGTLRNVLRDVLRVVFMQSFKTYTWYAMVHWHACNLLSLHAKTVGLQDRRFACNTLGLHANVIQTSCKRHANVMLSSHHTRHVHMQHQSCGVACNANQTIPSIQTIRANHTGQPCPPS